MIKILEVEVLINPQERCNDVNKDKLKREEWCTLDESLKVQQELIWEKDLRLSEQSKKFLFISEIEGKVDYFIYFLIKYLLRDPFWFP